VGSKKGIVADRCKRNENSEGTLKTCLILSQNCQNKKSIAMEWQKNLKRMKLAYLQRTAPGFFEASGGFTMSVAGYKDNNANALTHAISDYLKFNDWAVNRKGNCVRATFQGRHIVISVAGMQNHEGVDFVAKDMVSFIAWFNQMK
jgi:hypothetical protein